MDSRIRIVPAEFRHVNRLALNMRSVDRIECEAFGRTPKAALRHGIIASTWARTALLDGEPHAMFGLVVESALTGEGVPWFLGTDEVYRHGRALLSLGPGMIALMGDSIRVARNLVSADNRRAIRLLERWGFAVEADTIAIGALPFRRFSMEFR